jgi:AraC-like DNA-binding protein
MPESRTLFRYAHRAQLLALAWLEPDPLVLLPLVWTALRPILPGFSIAEVPHAAAILVQLASRFFDVARAPRRRQQTSVTGATVSRALELILHTATDTDVSLAKIAQHMHLSVSRLSHLIRTQSGHAFRTHVNGVRVLAAIRLLPSYDCSVKEVAWRVGYPDTPSLDRQMVAWTTLRPRDFKRMMLGRDSNGRVA